MSQSAPSPSAQPATLPTLPFELQVYIILLVAEDLAPGYDGTPGPSDTLRALAALSLVSCAFRDLAQAHLFAEVTISTKVDVERFFAVVGDGDRSRSVARLVRTLRVGRLDSSNSLMFRGALHLTRAEEYGLDDLLKACSNITELKLASVEEVELESLRFVPNLRNLYIWSCELLLYGANSKSPPYSPSAEHRPDPWSLKLPHLERLYLTDDSLATYITEALLRTSALPTLSTLSFALNDLRDDLEEGPAWTLDSIHAPIVQQVRSLSTSDPITSCFNSATRLVFLDTWHVGLNLKTIRHLPPSIRFLRLNPLAFTGRMAVDVFNEAWNKWEGEVLLKLEEIWVPATYAEEELYDPLRATCKRRGVRLVYEREWDKPEGWVMDEEAAFDGAFWDCAAMVDKVLKEEQRRGVEV